MISSALDQHRCACADSIDLCKRTMSICDVLFGVTMQIRGVSKKISVRFDEYDADEETAAA